MGWVFLTHASWAHLALRLSHSRFILACVGFYRLTHLKRIWPCTSAIVDFSWHRSGFLNSCVSGTFGFVSLPEWISFHAGWVFLTYTSLVHLALCLCYSESWVFPSWRVSNLSSIVIDFLSLLCRSGSLVFLLWQTSNLLSSVEDSISLLRHSGSRVFPSLQASNLLFAIMDFISLLHLSRSRVFPPWWVSNLFFVMMDFMSLFHFSGSWVFLPWQPSNLLLTMTYFHPFFVLVDL